jgi:hypothetical protein
MKALHFTLLLPLLAASLAGCEWHVHDYGPDPGTASPSSSSTGGASAPSSATDAPSASTTTTTTTTSGGPTCAVPIDRWKELLVINRSVLSDLRAKNDVDGAPWSFRTRLEELAGTAAEAPALAEAWLSEWKTRTSVGVDGAPVTPRPSVDEVILQPWRQNGSPATTYASGTPLPLALAPFRLVAIANRLDLRESEAGCQGAAGELRFVYTAVDVTTHLAVPFSVIVEIPYPASHTPREWAARWHDVASHPFGAEYNDALAALTAEITSNAVRSTVRARTNEVALGLKLGLPWELREFGLDTTHGPARLLQVPLMATPRIDLQRSPSLDAWAADNASKVLAGTFTLPGGFQAGAAPMATSLFRWESTTLPEALRHALSLGTCNGCHGGERPGDLLKFQHVAPGDTTAGYYTTTSGETQVSRFLNDPFGADDELGRRAKGMALMLCNACAAAATPTPPYGP